MIYTQHLCAKCGSEPIRRNGTSQGHAKYQCKACGYQARFMPAAAAKVAQYAQVEKLLVERNSQRSIVRAKGVARMTVAKLAKKSAGSLACLTPPAAEEGAAKTMGSARTRLNVGVCRQQSAESLALACRRTSQSAHRSVGRRRPQCANCATLVGGVASSLPPPLLVFYRPLGRLWQGFATLAASSVSKRRRVDQYC